MQTPTLKAKPRVVPPWLLVDDDDTFRNRLSQALSDRGHKVHTARDADEAILLAGQHQPTRAVVDLRMPGRSGLKLVELLKARHPDLQIIVLTGYGSITTAKQAIRLGAHDYLTKPADTDQIIAAFDAAPGPPGANEIAENHNAESTTHSNSDPNGEDSAPSLARVEWEHIQRVLHDCQGNVSQAARVLGIHRRSLQRKLAKLPPPEQVN